MGPSSPGEAQVWADAASFFNSRIQASGDAFPGRKADMSPEAAKAMEKELAGIATQSNAVDPASLEAAQMLMSNYVRVVQDITNPGPNNIDGKKLTQTELKRVDIKHQALVDAMVREVCCGLVGKATPKSLTREDALVWAEAACFLSARIQGTPNEMPGRTPDMSSQAATALRTMLAQMEAARFLSGRIQATPNEMPGRKPDMSSDAATA